MLLRPTHLLSRRRSDNVKDLELLAETCARDICTLRVGVLRFELGESVWLVSGEYKYLGSSIVCIKVYSRDIMDSHLFRDPLCTSPGIFKHSNVVS